MPRRERFADAMQATQEAAGAHRAEPAPQPSGAWPSDVLECLQRVDQELVGLGEHGISESAS
jgi:hypothetical protein